MSGYGVRLISTECCVCFMLNMTYRALQRPAGAIVCPTFRPALPDVHLCHRWTWSRAQVHLKHIRENSDDIALALDSSLQINTSLKHSRPLKGFI